MLVSPLRWLISNLSALLLAFALAVVVWISAVTEADPNVERIRTVPIEVIGQNRDMLLINMETDQVRITLRTPQSVWERYGAAENALEAWVDLTGLDSGQHLVEVQYRINPSFTPVRVVQVSPDVITVEQQLLDSRSFPVNLEITGEPVVGYQKGLAARNPATVTVSGPAEQVAQVEEVRAALDITDATETIQTSVPLLPVDGSGDPVEGVNVTPSEVEVTQPITLQESYRNVVVRVVTTGQVANGYKLTNISVAPPNVVVFSPNPELVNSLPSFVETEPIDLTGATDDLETFVDLNLPEGVSVTGDPTVLVQVSIGVLEDSLRVTLPVSPVGLLPGQAAVISPDMVDVILSGPVPILNRMTSTDVRVIADLRGLDFGTHQVDLSVDVLPDQVQVETILPSTVEVEIITAPTTTPTSPAAPTQTVQP